MPREVIVSDHAVLRHLQRRLGIDVEAARAEVEAICRRGADKQADSVLHAGLRYVLRHWDGGTTVVTALRRRVDYVHRCEPPR